MKTSPITVLRYSVSEHSLPWSWGSGRFRERKRMSWKKFPEEDCTHT